MARIRPNPHYLLDTRRLWEQAPTRNERKKIIDEARAPFGYSYSHMTRLVGLGAHRRSLSPSQRERVSEIESYARKVYEFVALSEFDQGAISVKSAYDSLLGDGQIPEEISLKAIRAHARKIGLINEYRSPARVFHGRSAPLHLVMVDYSKSKYFRVAKNGSIHFNASGKDSTPRLFIAAAVDLVSRVVWFRYYHTEGESAAFVRDVMLGAFAEKPLDEPITDYHTGEIQTHRKILQGIPREVYIDRGSGNKSKEVAAGLMALKITRIIGSVEYDTKGRRTNRSNSKARGLIERFIGIFKQQLENSLRNEERLGKLPPSLTLDELNARALDFSERSNAKPHPVLPHLDRWSVFLPALHMAEFPPEHAAQYFGGYLPRRVQRGLIQGHTRRDWFIAPEIAYDGQTVHVVLSGRDCYLFDEQNQLIKLRPQAGSIREVIESETGAEVYHEFLLKQRFATELESQSFGMVTMRMLPDSLEAELQEFFGAPQSVRDISMRVAAILEFVRQQSKIIPFRRFERGDA